MGNIIEHRIEHTDAILHTYSLLLCLFPLSLKFQSVFAKSCIQKPRTVIQSKPQLLELPNDD
jgi:hypothetical protein